MTKRWEDILRTNDHIEVILHRRAMEGVEQYRTTGEVAGLDAAIRYLRVWREFLRLEAEEA